MNISTQRHLSRRTFLRAAGVSLGLPVLESMTPAFAAPKQASTVPRRMVAICNDLSLIPEYFFPKETGPDYQLSPYLRTFADLRDDFTVFSGISHPEVDGGHDAEKCFLTGAPHPRRGGFRNSISLDQFAADHIGQHTRFPSLPLIIGPEPNSLSCTADGVQLPAESMPSRIFAKLFVQGTPREVEEQLQRLREGRSLMDGISDRARTLQRSVTPRDKDRLEQFFTAVRDFEKRLEQAEKWELKPRPKVESKSPKDHPEAEAYIPRTRAMFEVARLALETDSTRLITLMVGQSFNPKVDLPGVTLPHHALTHQGGVGTAHEQLRIIEEAHLGEVATLLRALRDSPEDDANLLDRSMVLYGSNLGSAARHDNTNLPILLAGGGFKHGQHLVFNKNNNTPLANLFVTMLQRLGVETDRFSSSTGTLRGMEMI